MAAAVEAPTVEATAERVRELNERVLTLTSHAGQSAVEAYQSMLQSILSVEKSIAGASQLDLLKTMVSVQAEFAQDIGRAYVSAARNLLR